MEQISQIYLFLLETLDGVKIYDCKWCQQVTSFELLFKIHLTINMPSVMRLLPHRR